MLIQEKQLLRKQRGELATLLIYGIVIAAVVTGVGYVVYSYNSAITEANTLRTSNATLQASLGDQLKANDDLTKENKRINTLLKQRQEARIVQQDIERALDAALAKVFANDQKAKDWANTSIPESVVSSLRSTTTDTGDKDKPKAIPSRTAITDSKGSSLGRNATNN